MVYFGNKPTTRHVLHLCGSLQDETEVYNGVRCVLNKLTPEKFDILVARISTAPFLASADLSARIADLIIDKASEEELYSNLYAEFCRALSINDSCSGSEDGADLEDKEAARRRRLDLLLLESPQPSSQFNATISEKCSRLFKAYLHELEYNPENRDEDGQRVYRKKAVGFMKFVGELYRSEVLSDAFIAEVLRELSDLSGASRVELASKLVTTAGQLVERATHFSAELNEIWSGIWERLELVKDEGDWLSTRLRYMVYDLLELKSNGWTPRKFLRERQPATLSDIRLQLETESSLEMEMAIKSQQTKAKEMEEQLVSLLQNADRLKVFLNRNRTTKGSRRHLVVFALTRAIVKTSLTESGDLELSEDKLKVLREFIQSDIELEAVCINALQNLIIVHLGSHQGLLYRAFDRMYRSGILSVGGFHRWKDGPELPPLPRSRNAASGLSVSSSASVSPFLLGSEGRSRATVIAATYLLSL